MKKVRKLLVLCCVLCLLLPLLCGCAALDDARKSQAFFDEEGNILWNGAVYKMLPQGRHFCPETNDRRIYVTKPDVPVLLQDSFCEMALDADAEGLILEQAYNYASGYAVRDCTYYCREDRYEEIAKRLQEPFQPDMICYSYYTYNAETGEYEDHIYKLTDEEWGVLQKILETQEPMEIGEGWELNYDSWLQLEERSEDQLFCRDSVSVMGCGNTYYLRISGEELYQVPADAAPHVAKLLREKEEKEKVIFPDTEVIA